MIVNSSPLIVFGKLNSINILLELFHSIEIAEGVYKEAIIEGMERRFEDSLVLKHHLDADKIKVIRLENKYLEMAGKIQDLNNIGVGESQTIALAKQIGRKELIIDDLLARKASKSLGLKPTGSLGILLLAYEQDIMSEKDVNDMVSKMIKMKFRVSALTLITFRELLEKIKNRQGKK